MFHELFDLNGDGQMDAAEQALEFMVYQEVTGEEEDENDGQD